MKKFNIGLILQPVGHVFSLLYGAVALTMGITYVFPIPVALPPSLRAIQFVLPLQVWGILFVVAAALIFGTSILKVCRHLAHLYAGCVWAAWTGIIIAATISNILPAGAPFSTGSFLIGHVILAVHFRSVKIKE